MSVMYREQFAFYEQLRRYYERNRGKIRSRYNELTKKLLAHNDHKVNPNAFLRTPQFEALEMYVFIKEFLDNRQMHEIFDLWRRREGVFSDASYYSINRSGQKGLPLDLVSYDGKTVSMPDAVEKQTEQLFRQMKNYREAYPNYIYALTMGLGKTILMATCIFYEFLLAQKYPKDKRYCHNALVFAPDKTVLQSLREIVAFDKTKVVPPEYARVLDANVKFHFLEDTGTTLNTVDQSDFNVVISNTQKIIVKRKHKKETPADALFTKSALLSAVYCDEASAEDDELRESDNLTINQRFKKLCRLTGLGIYVDEAHHLFGADLEKQLREDAKKTSLRSTINMLAADLKSSGGSVVACYNYTGTPYVKNQVLPEVVYAYSLRDSISRRYLKDCDVKGYENVKSEEFLREAVTHFWKEYGGKTYEGLIPKLAIFAATIDEAVSEVRPAVEKALSDLGIPLSGILVNVGDTKYTKEDDIRHFNNLDVEGTEGSRKQFLILVNKGREGWNCRSLFGVALFRSPASKIFVLQATMRCLRKITDEQQTATVFLSKENFDTLNAELNQNFNMEIKDLKESREKNPKFKVRVLPPPRKIKLKMIRHEYGLVEKGYACPVDFNLAALDLTRYVAKVYEKDGISTERSVKEHTLENVSEQMKYSLFTLTGEIARYMNLSPVLINKILTESVDGAGKVLEFVNKYNAILPDVIIPKIFNALFEVTREVSSEERELTLLREPKEGGWYEFSAKPELVICREDDTLKNEWRGRSFHADTYCFDSKPEKECFLQYISNADKVSEVYFTGMFTSDQGDLSVQYYDPDSGRIRRYYPDFFAKMTDGSYQIIEVKGDNKIEEQIVKIKAAAAREIAAESDIEYIMYAGSVIMNSNILERDMSVNAQLSLLEKWRRD